MKNHMGVLMISEPPLELLKGEGGGSLPTFHVDGSTYYHDLAMRIRCPSTLWMLIRVSTGAVWPAGLELKLMVGTSRAYSDSKKFPKIDGANQTHEREFKVHFWYDPSTDFTNFESFVLEAGVWVSDEGGGFKPYDPQKTRAVVHMRNSAGSGTPGGVGLHIEKLRLLRGLH